MEVRAPASLEGREETDDLLRRRFNQATPDWPSFFMRDSGRYHVETY